MCSRSTMVDKIDLSLGSDLLGKQRVSPRSGPTPRGSAQGAMGPEIDRGSLAGRGRIVSSPDSRPPPSLSRLFFRTLQQLYRCSKSTVIVRNRESRLLIWRRPLNNDGHSSNSDIPVTGSDSGSGGAGLGFQKGNLRFPFSGLVDIAVQGCRPAHHF